MSSQQNDTLIQRIRRYNWQTHRRRNIEPEYYWYGDESEYIAIKPAYEGPLNSYPPATKEQLQQTEDLLGFSLPPLLLSLYMQIANGGFGPGYGIIGAIGGFPLMDGMGEDIAHGYLRYIERYTLIRLEDYKMISWAQRDRYLKQLPSEQVLDWDKQPLPLHDTRFRHTSKWNQVSLYEFPHEVWPERLLPLCYWGCSIGTYFDARTEDIFQVYASDRGWQYILEYKASSLEEWFERWLSGERLQ